MSTTVPNDDVIEYRGEAITQKCIDAFRHATRTRFTEGIPLTFVTRFRMAEFQWVHRLNFELHHLLHTEQVYEYKSAFKEGEVPLARTRLVGHRDRKTRDGLISLVELESQIYGGDELKAIARTHFMVRRPEGAK